LPKPAQICYWFNMRPGGRFSAFCAVLVAGLLTSGLTLAGETAASSSELSPSALGMDTGSSRGYEPGDDKAKRPGEIQFGNNTLHFDADKKNPVPPVGLEANGQTVLNKAPTEPALHPSYLGLRLTTPIH
jgi:hypothetical protein